MWGVGRGVRGFIRCLARCGKGKGKLRRVKVGCLRAQEKQASGELRYKKVADATKPSDALTKYLNGDRHEELIKTMNHSRRDGRAKVGVAIGALHVAGTGSPSIGGSVGEGECKGTLR